MAQTLVSKKPESLWVNRNYLLLWSGQSLSLLGDWFFAATITLWIIDRLARGQSWLPLALAGVGLAVALPALLLAPFTGVFVDRWDRRMTMFWTDVLRMILVALFLLLTLVVQTPSILLGSSLVTLLLCSCGTQFFLPARVVAVNDFVAPEQHPMAFGSLQQASYFAQILGPSVAAPLYLTFGPAWAIALNAASFLISSLLILALRIPAKEEKGTREKRSFWQEMREGLRFFLGNRVLVTLLISGMIFMFGGQAYNGFQYLYGQENLGIPVALLGLYVASYSVGIVIGIPLAANLAKRWSQVEILWCCLVLNGLLIILLSRLTTMIPGVICVFFMGITNSSILVTVRPLTVRVTPRDLVGRVMAFELPMINLAALVGGALAGVLASTALQNFHASFGGMRFGPLDTIFLAVGLLTIGSGIYARLMLYPAVKRLDAAEALAQKTSGAANNLIEKQE